MNHQTNSFRKLPQIKDQFLAGVELGMPSKKCVNFGICRIIPMGKFGSENSDCKCNNQFEAVVSILGNNEVEISFLRGSVDYPSLEKYFITGMFLVEEDFKFLAEGIEGFVIKEGNYPVKIDSTFIKVRFQ